MVYKNKQVIRIQMIMACFIACAFIVGAIFPSIPGFAYLVAAVVVGTALLILRRGIQAEPAEVISDERDRENAHVATTIVFRIITIGCSLAGGSLSALYASGTPARIVGLTLFAVGMLSLLVQGGIALFLDWKSR